MSFASPCSQAPARWLILSVDCSDQQTWHAAGMQDCLLRLHQELQRRALQAAWLVSSPGKKGLPAVQLPPGECILRLPAALAAGQAARESLGDSLHGAQEQWPQHVFSAVAVEGSWHSPHGDLLARRGIQAVVTLPQALSWPKRLLGRKSSPAGTGALQVLRYGLRRLPVTHLLPRQVSAFAHLARRAREQHRYLHLLIPAAALLSGRGAQAVTLALELAQELVHRHQWCCVAPGELLAVLESHTQRQGATSILRRAA